jgi:hypothetical protein
MLSALVLLPALLAVVARGRKAQAAPEAERRLAA